MATRNYCRSILVGAALAGALVLSACSSGESGTDASLETEAPSQASATPTEDTEPDKAATSTTEPSAAEETPAEPLYIGNDAAFDYLVGVRDSLPQGWRIDTEALPAKQEVTGRVRPEMVNPERCAQLASLAEAGYLAEEGPLQYITDANLEDDADDFIVVGQAPLGILQDITAVLPDCSTFAVSRQSPSVIDNTPTQDVITYQVEAETLDNGYLLLQFTAEGVVQITDTDFTCLSLGNRDCMYDKSIRGYRLIRQDGETMTVAGVTNTKTKGGSAARPMKVNDFLTDAEPILDSLEIPQS